MENSSLRVALCMKVTARELILPGRRDQQEREIGDGVREIKGVAEIHVTPLLGLWCRLWLQVTWKATEVLRRAVTESHCREIGSIWMHVYNRLLKGKDESREPSKEKW